VTGPGSLRRDSTRNLLRFDGQVDCPSHTACTWFLITIELCNLSQATPYILAIFHFHAHLRWCRVWALLYVQHLANLAAFDQDPLARQICRHLLHLLGARSNAWLEMAPW
jgi:hypothetical protein